jgi:hypothetical protein
MELFGNQLPLVERQIFKNSYHQAHTQNQVVQLLLWLKHGVLAVVELVDKKGLLPLVQVVAVAVELMRIVYLKPLMLEQQKQ